MLRVGCAKADITPPVGLPLSGFAVRQNRPSVAIDDPLFVKALVLEWDGEACLLLSYDLLGLDFALDREIRAGLAGAFGERFPAERVLITTTHTHSGPPAMPIAGETRVPEEYTRRLCAATQAAAAQAIECLAEVELFHAAEEVEGINHNRRRRSFPDQPAERFPVDRRLDLFAFRDPRGECRGAFARFSCHAVTMTTQHVSADFPGELTRRFEDQLGAPCLFLQGTAGDANPTTEHQDHPAMLAFVDALWAQLGGLVDKLQPVTVDGLRVEERVFPLEFAPFPSKETLLAEIARNERILAGDQASPDLQDLIRAYAGWRYPDDPDIQGAVAHWAGVYQEAERVTLRAIEATAGEAPAVEAAVGFPSVPFRAAALRLGPFTLVFLSGEILTPVGQRIQALAPGRDVQVISYLSPIVGYIAGEEDARLGGYEAGSAWMWYRMPGPFRADTAGDIIAQVDKILYMT